MVTPTIIKGIWIPIKYGLSNKKCDFWGTSLVIYTLIWIIYAVLFVIIPFFILDFNLDISFFVYIISLLFFVLPFYFPIYIVWYLDKKDIKKNKYSKNIDEKKEIQRKMEPANIQGGIQLNTQKNQIQSIPNIQTQNEVITYQSNISTTSQPQLNMSSVSTQTKNIIKSMDKILQNEPVIDALSGQKKTDAVGDARRITNKTTDMLPSALVLTHSRIVFYKKKILGGYQSKDYPIKSISSITFNSGLIYDGIKLHTQIENLEIGDISKKDHTENFVNNVKSCMSSSESRPMTKVNAQTLNISMTRETEFYQGFIRLKMSITNTTVFVIHDVTLDFYFDEVILRRDRYEPDYQIKNGKIILGNINSGSSKSVAVYFDPMMCSKGTEIKCQINYSNAKGQIQTTWMEPKNISVVCPIMKTDSNINIGRLKEFVEKLPHRDSKIYQIHTDFDIKSLKAISREVIQKHDVKNIRTLYTKDGKTCEIWYYGKTKVNNHDIVIRITILSENQSIELFAATQTAESLTGLLAEFGRELLLTIEDKITGKNNVNQVINVLIKDSIIQRSNLLSYCNIDGKCTGDVIIEDSIVQRSDIGLNAEVNDSFIQKTDVGGSSCPVCGRVVPDGAKFCNECGGKLK